MATAIAETVRAEDGTARRTTRPERRAREVHDEVADQLAGWLTDHDDTTKARVVARFRL